MNNHLDTDYLSITTLLNQWINPAPVKLDLDPNQAELIKFQLSKNDSMEVYGFFDVDELSWFPTISGLHADQGSPTKKFLLIESPRNQNRIEYKNVKQF